jgi:adenosine deaminase
MSLESYLRAAPKAELHVHLEGSVKAATALELARRNGDGLPEDVTAILEGRSGYRDFEQFIRVYLAVTRCLRTAEDYERIVFEHAAGLAGQNVRYTEVTFSPSTHALFLGVPERVFLDGLARGRRRAAEELGVEIRWIFDIVARSADPARYYDYTTAVAIEQGRDGVVALGLVGMGIDREAEAFVPYVERARRAGLHFVPHAGELGGAEQVWAALRVLGAERIGHGVRSWEDPALVAHLATSGIPLEVCPTSNVRLGVYPDLASHPLRRLREAGVRVTVNSDDPALFGTTLEDEVATLATGFGFGPADVAAVDDILLGGVRHSFLPPQRKATLVADFTRELDRLKAGHPG